MTQTILIAGDGTFTEGEWDGSEDNAAEVSYPRPGVTRIALIQYYNSRGEFEMQISRPLPEAVRIFAAALREDTALEQEAHR